MTNTTKAAAQNQMYESYLSFKDKDGNPLKWSYNIEFKEIRELSCARLLSLLYYCLQEDNFGIGSKTENQYNPQRINNAV